MKRSKIYNDIRDILSRHHDNKYRNDESCEEIVNYLESKQLPSELTIEDYLKEITKIVRTKEGKPTMGFYVHYIQPIKQYLKTGNIIQRSEYVDNATMKSIDHLESKQLPSDEEVHNKISELVNKQSPSTACMLFYKWLKSQIKE